MGLLSLQHPRPGPSRWHLAAVAASRLGLLRAVRCARVNRGLLVLAYHRIGDPAGCPVDGGVFNATERDLEFQVRVLQRWTRAVTLDEVEQCYASGRPFRQALTLLTFDDAYRDNYLTAFPILQAAGAPATFFVATSFLERQYVPWWDRIAYAVKHARTDDCVLKYPEGLKIEAARSEPQSSIRMLLRLYKDRPDLDKTRFLEAIEEAMGASALDAPEVGELFASWAELRAMVEAGMAVGSHTHTHRLLGHLPYAEQCEELARSRELIAERLGVEVRSLAYPVGHQPGLHFNDETRRALAALGYRLAFSHYNGWNRSPTDCYDIRRTRVDREVSAELLQATISLPSVFG